MKSKKMFRGIYKCMLSVTKLRLRLLPISMILMFCGLLFFRLPLWLVAIITLLYGTIFFVGLKINLKLGKSGVDITEEVPLEDIQGQSKLKKLFYLASLVDEYGDEKIILEGMRHGIAGWRMKSAIFFHKNEWVGYLFLVFSLLIIFYFYAKDSKSFSDFIWKLVFN